MELIAVYCALCVALAFNFVKETHTVPVGGLLSGLFGGDDGGLKQQVAPVDINQLLRQYYTAQSEDQLARFNPFGQINSAVGYGQQPPQPQAPSQVDGGFPGVVDPYMINPYANINPYQINPYQSPYAPDPYTQQLYPVYRGGMPPSGLEDPSGIGAPSAAEQFTKQLDSLMPKDVGLSEISSYRSGLSAPTHVDSQSPNQAREIADSRAPVASSLVAHRVLPDSDSHDSPAQVALAAPKAVDPNNSKDKKKK